MQSFLKRPVETSCFIVKRPFSEAIYSIDRDGKRAVVAFKRKEQAHVMKRLIFDVQIKDPRKKKTIVVERTNVELLVRTCGLSGLDLVVYGGDNSFLVYNACDHASDDFRFEFENRFRFGP